jgi:hypothetical protein
MLVRNLLAISFSLAVVSVANAQYWNLAGNWAPPANPNGVWTYGELFGTTFTNLTYSGSSYEDGGVPLIGKNTSSSAVNGINPGQVWLAAGIETPDARWTAPTSAFYAIELVIGGTQATEGGGTGNLFAVDSGLNINGAAQTGNYSTTNNTKTWVIVWDYLTAGTTVDAYVPDPGGGAGADTQTYFQVTAVPEPAPVAVMTLGALGLFVRRRKPSRLR